MLTRQDPVVTVPFTVLPDMDVGFQAGHLFFFPVSGLWNCHLFGVRNILYSIAAVLLRTPWVRFYWGYFGSRALLTELP